MAAVGSLGSAARARGAQLSRTASTAPQDQLNVRSSRREEALIIAASFFILFAFCSVRPSDFGPRISDFHYGPPAGLLTQIPNPSETRGRVPYKYSCRLISAS